MTGRVVSDRPAGCGHAWRVLFDQGVTLVLECEFCDAVLAVEVSEHAHGGYAFAFYALRGTVSGEDCRVLGDWFTKDLGHEVQHVDMRAARRRRRRAPARAA